MTADEFVFGPCRAGTERDWPCSQAAVDDSQLCRYHRKLRLRMTVPWRPEPLTDRKKVKVSK